ncbi:hypothetical protein [Staphylococcus sp. NAM3COL9]|uniref:hypothetical protein n=1 Tax=Staphylococcus sp. NAM3COL9 TaxID=1667172 RepID=UPI00070C9B66|nr:hypothetical protein [Staphylococcus sp. NAM3COL9]KRG10994.1 hypothetical protein ACA31_01400 [Staphylococcus sp. NAM3COL9]
MSIILTLIVGAIIGISLSLWLTSNSIPTIIVSLISGVLGAFIGTSLLLSTGMYFLITAFIGAITLTLVVLFIIETSKEIVRY